MTLRTWFVYLGKFKVGDIFHVDGGKWVITAPNHTSESDRFNRYESYASAVNFYRMSVPEEARSCFNFIEQPSV